MFLFFNKMRENYHTGQANIKIYNYYLRNCMQISVAPYYLYNNFSLCRAPTNRVNYVTHVFALRDT